MTTNEKIMIVLTVVSIGLSFYFAKKSNDNAWAIARGSGSFNRPEFSVGIGESQILASNPSRVVIGARELSFEKGPVVGSLPLSVISTGEKTVESVIVTFQYNKVMQRSLLEDLNFVSYGSTNSKKLDKSFTESDYSSFSSYMIETLNPKTAVVINEPLFMIKTTINNVVRVKTKDNVEADVSYKVKYAHQVNVMVQAKDITAKSYPLTISIEKANTLRELVEQNFNVIIKKEQEEVRERTSFFKYMFTLFTSRQIQSIYFVFVPLKEHSQDGNVLFTPMEKIEVATVKYNLLTLKLLFNFSSKFNS